MARPCLFPFAAVQSLEIPVEGAADEDRAFAPSPALFFGHTQTFAVLPHDRLCSRGVGVGKEQAARRMYSSLVRYCPTNSQLANKFFRMSGDEGEIRTRGGFVESVSYRFSVALTATNDIDAVDHCTLLHADSICF